MSAGHQHRHTEAPEDYAKHDAFRHQLLDDPKYAAAVQAYTKEDDVRHPVPGWVKQRWRYSVL